MTNVVLHHCSEFAVWTEQLYPRSLCMMEISLMNEFTILSLNQQKRARYAWIICMISMMLMISMMIVTLMATVMTINELIRCRWGSSDSIWTTRLVKFLNSYYFFYNIIKSHCCIFLGSFWWGVNRWCRRLQKVNDSNIVHKSTIKSPSFFCMFSEHCYPSISTYCSYYFY